jgi:prepilin-type N-terminal cleavage/methylation domain-containing protein
MSLIELLIAIAIVAVLSGGAYTNYADHVSNAKMAVARTTLRKFGEALQCYNSDHIGGYTTSDPSHLLGSYTSENPEDPWGQVFVVDYFFGRILSTGPDASLDTLVPYHPWHPLTATRPASDDIIFGYERTGRISYVRSTALSLMDADGARDNTIISGARAGTSGSNGALALHVNNTGEVFLVEDLGEVTVEKELLPPSGTAPPMLSGVSLDSGVSNGGREICWAPDMLRYAVVCEYAGASAVMVCATTSAQQPFIVCTAPPGSTFVDCVFDGRGTRLFLTMHGDSAYEDSIFVAAAAEHSTITTYIGSTYPGSPKQQVACSKNNKYLIYSDDTDSYLVNSSTREVLTSYPGATWPTFSPDSKKVAFVYNSYQIYGAHLTEFPDQFIQLTDFASSILITSLDWD